MLSKNRIKLIIFFFSSGQAYSRQGQTLQSNSGHFVQTITYPVKEPIQKLSSTVNKRKRGHTEERSAAGIKSG